MTWYDWLYVVFKCAVVFVVGFLVVAGAVALAGDVCGKIQKRKGRK